MKKPVTISRIAKEAGVSVSTVSRVLNNKPDVLDETRERVLQVIDTYHFQANAYAKGIVQKKSHTIAMVIAHDVEYVFMNQYFTEVMRGVITETQRRGYFVLSLYCKSILEAMSAFQQQRVDGILLISPTAEHQEAAEHFAKNDVPVVSVGAFPNFDTLPCVKLDDYEGASAAMEYLLSRGHRRIAYIGGPGKVPSTEARNRAYLNMMREYGCPVTSGMFQKSDGMIASSDMVDRILRDTPDITAIFAGSDYVAIGVINALQSRGLRVPEDISVVGFDDVPMSSQIVPKVTTVRQDGDRKGALAASMLIDWIETGEMPESATIKTELVIRDSVCEVL